MEGVGRDGVGRPGGVGRFVVTGRGCVVGDALVEGGNGGGLGGAFLHLPRLSASCWHGADRD